MILESGNIEGKHIEEEVHEMMEYLGFERKCVICGEPILCHQNFRINDNNKLYHVICREKEETGNNDI